jgi:hypothetical protein
MSDLTPKLPEVKFNKNGYEIRADILAMAKDHVQNEYSYKFQGWEMTAARDEKTGQIVSYSQHARSFQELIKFLKLLKKCTHLSTTAWQRSKTPDA